jgi:hypothetical protein
LERRHVSTRRDGGLAARGGGSRLCGDARFGDVAGALVKGS